MTLPSLKSKLTLTALLIGCVLSSATPNSAAAQDFVEIPAGSVLHFPSGDSVVVGVHSWVVSNDASLRIDVAIQQGRADAEYWKAQADGRELQADLYKEAVDSLAVALAAERVRGDVGARCVQAASGSSTAHVDATRPLLTRNRPIFMNRDVLEKLVMHVAGRVAGECAHLQARDDTGSGFFCLLGRESLPGCQAGEHTRIWRTWRMLFKRRKLAARAVSRSELDVSPVN